MSVTDVQDMRAEQIYRPLDFSKNEIRLLEFKDHVCDREVPLQLDLYHVSLDDWDPEFVTLRNQNPSADILQLAQAEENTIFKWGIYTCLSYTRGDCEGEKATIFVNGVATPVDKYLEHALRDVGGSDHVHQLWVDALCINNADTFDRNQHALRRKVIFGHAWRILACVHDSKELTDYELGYIHSDQPGDAIDWYCEFLMMDCGRQVLEEALGVRHRNWGAAEQQEEIIRDEITAPLALMFDEHLGVPWRKDRESDSGDEDWHEPEPCNVRFLDIIQSYLLTLLQKQYWSRLEIIQELTENPDKTLLQWGHSWGAQPIPFPVYLALGDVLLNLHKDEEPADPELWKKLKPKLDLWSFITRRKELETATGGAERLDNVGVRELNSLVARASCTFPQDRVYAILGLFPPSVSGAVRVDYNQDAAVTMAQFRSVVPGWNCNRLEPRSESDDEGVCQGSMMELD
ncbi:unnamed protein product [Clonostachys solani]|uniref:Heterokaryon incompatibility domain-containing protein n=1 Tax=Clonostachys solani TaxID=160281 RepID=A0A9P0ENY2_9HYPO|nr:unnamed protein product [Clonostachys solani]